MSYKVLHVGKCKMSGVGAMANHMMKRDKVKTNDNIDLERSAENYAIDGMTAEHLEERVRARVRESVRRKVRPDAVGLDDIIIGASHDWMMEHSKQERDEYFRMSLAWARKRYGADNVMYAVVHMDETTPHMHLGVVPIKDGCLSSKKVFGKAELRAMHDDFTRDVAAAYGLERGGDRADARTPLTLNELKKETKERAASAAMAAQAVDELRHEARIKRTLGGLGRDDSLVEMPVETFRELSQGAMSNAELAAQAAAAVVAQQAAETRAKVAEERAERAQEAIRERDELREVVDACKTYIDAPQDVVDMVEQERQKELMYQQNVQRMCVCEFLRQGRDFNAAVASMSETLDGIGVCGKDHQQAFVRSCLREARKQGTAVFHRNKKTGKQEARKGWKPSAVSGKMSGGGGGSSWHASARDTNFLARFSNPGMVAVSGRLGEVPWDELTDEEREEKMFWADMFR